MEKIWVVKDPDEYLPAEDTFSVSPELSHSSEKSPAAAYSLSLLFWGAGQIYNGQKRKGQLFLFLMLLSCTGAVISLLFWIPLFHMLRSYDISCLSIFIAAEVLFFGALVFWSYNARVCLSYSGPGTSNAVYGSTKPRVSRPLFLDHSRLGTASERTAG